MKGWVLLVSKAENMHVLGGRIVWWKGVLPISTIYNKY